MIPSRRPQSDLRLTINYIGSYAIMAIDQYAEAAFGNREFFLNKPYGIGGWNEEDIPDDDGVRTSRLYD